MTVRHLPYLRLFLPLREIVISAALLTPTVDCTLFALGLIYKISWPNAIIGYRQLALHLPSNA
jgi:hypothetical protein